MELINSFITVTNLGGVYTSGGLAKLLDPSVPTSGEGYYWDDGGSAREGFRISVPSGFIVQKVQFYGSPGYPIAFCGVEQNGVKLADKSSATWNSPLEWVGSMTGTFEIIRYATHDQAATRIHVWGTRGKGLIKSNGKYYHPIAANYDATARAFKPTAFTDATITVADVDAGMQLGDLFIPITVGDETFAPISKFNDFQIASSIINMSLTAIRRNNAMIVTKKTLYSRGIKNIDKIVATATVPAGSRIKIVISDDNGDTWKTTSNAGLTWRDIAAVVPKKNYSEMTDSEKNSWRAAVESFDTSGIDAVGISTINFNAFIGKKIMFAVVMYQPTFTTIPSMNTITWQYDESDVYRRMRDSEVEVDIVDETTVKITPLIANDSIKVNISNG